MTRSALRCAAVHCTTRDAFESYKGSAMFSTVGARLQAMLAESPKSAYYESDNVFGGACAAQ